MNAANEIAPLPARSSFPMDFRLEDGNGNPAIYITADPAEEHHLLLVLTNRSAQPIMFGPAGPHFELRFRKGTLSSKTLDLLKSGAEKTVLAADPGWKFEFQDHAEDCSLNFTCSNPATLRSGDSITLALQQVSADPAGGVRVTQVAFAPRQLFYGDGIAVTGFRRQQLHVLSHLGKPHIPLHAALVDALVGDSAARQTILNDDVTPNCLCLRFTNVHQTQALKFNPEGSGTPTTLTVTIPTGDEKKHAWVVTSCKKAKDIDPEKSDWKHVNASERDFGVGRARVFNFVPIAAELGPNKSFDIVLKNIKSDAASGQATLLVEYGNIPGYWSGRFDVQVHKTPLMFSGKCVGVGTQIPASPLSVASNTDVPAFYVKQDGAGVAAKFAGRVEIGSASETSAFYVKQTGAGAAASFAGRVEITGVTESRPALAVHAASQGIALDVRQVQGGDAGFFDGPVRIIPGRSVGKNALAIETFQGFKAAALMVRSRGGNNAGYFVGRVYIGPRGPEIGENYSQDSTESLYIEGGVTVGGRLTAREFVPNYVSEWKRDDNSTTHVTHFAHQLGYVPAFVMLYFAPPSAGDAEHRERAGPIYPVIWNWHNEWSGNPITVELTSSEILLHIYKGQPLHGVWNASIGATDESRAWTKYTQGYWRVIAFGKQG